MSGQITNYKCPACTGPLHFGSGSGKLECEYCGSEFEVAEIENYYSEADAQAAMNAEKKDDEWDITYEEWNAEGMKTYNCSSCGAELIYDETTVANNCPYCDNPTLVPGQIAGNLKPEYVIPFKYDKEQAKQQLKAFYKGKLLLPKKFSNENHIEEMKGVYVPFWLYDGVVEGSGYYEGRTETTKEYPGYKVITTKHYNVWREGKIAFEKIPADASSQMPNDVMDSIEPYDYSEIKEFSPAYLAGYIADKYDETAEENEERAMERAKNTAKEELRRDVTGYTSVEEKNVNVYVKDGKASYAMMPVWILNTKWQDKKYMFAMNGQTGKMVGELPIDKAKAVLAYLITFIVSIIISAIVAEISLGTIIVSAVVSAVILWYICATMKNVAKANSAGHYIAGGGIKISKREDKYSYTSTRKVANSKND